MASDHPESSSQEPPPQRVLSIQSHVVYGYVGNKAAVFPLQLLGFDVDVVNSVHFSNHTGYAGGVEGDVLDGDQLRAILRGLRRNNLLCHVQHVLTGFIGSSSFLQGVLQVVSALRCNGNGKRHDVRFVCDPVLGDAGTFYVPRELVEVYKHQVIPAANVVTPNQFEVEQLTGIQVLSQNDALRACQALHDMGPELVFITSVILEKDDDDDDDDDKDAPKRKSDRDSGQIKTIAILASQRRLEKQKKHEVWRIDAPLLEGQFTGTGDLTAALLLGHTASNTSLPLALEKVIGTMSAVIARTDKVRGDTVASRELQLIQSQGDIQNPPPPPLGKAYRIG